MTMTITKIPSQKDLLYIWSWSSKEERSDDHHQDSLNKDLIHIQTRSSESA